MVLFNVRCTQTVRTVVKLLEILIKEMDRQGVILSIDRPHSYLRKLLEKHNIPQDKLMYLDAVMNISGDRPAPDRNLEMLSSPFCVNLIYETFVSRGMTETTTASGFLLFDNITSLRTYLTDSCIESFLGRLQKTGAEKCGIVSIIVMDKEACPGLYSTIQKLGALAVGS